MLVDRCLVSLHHARGRQNRGKQVERLRILQASALSYVWADRHLLQMALLQLVDNAAKYARPGTEIAFSVDSTDSEVVFQRAERGILYRPEREIARLRSLLPLC